MNDEQLLRYSRHLLLPELDVDGQEQLLAAHVVIMGLGGLGSPVALYLAAAGVGRLTLVDPDVVEASNLQRQVAHTQARLGATKVASAATAIAELNGDTAVVAIDRALTDAELQALFKTASVVVDGTDRFSSRYSINAAAWQAGVPLVSGAAIRWEGQVAVFDPRQADSPCYQCLHPDTGAQGGETCAENGVVAPLVGVIGSLQALETVKLISASGTSSVGTVTHFDGKYGEWRQLRLQRSSACPICGDR